MQFHGPGFSIRSQSGPRLTRFSSKRHSAPSGRASRRSQFRQDVVPLRLRLPAESDQRQSRVLFEVEHKSRQAGS